MSLTSDGTGYRPSGGMVRVAIVPRRGVEDPEYLAESERQLADRLKIVCWFAIVGIACFSLGDYFVYAQGRGAIISIRLAQCAATVALRVALIWMKRLDPLRVAGLMTMAVVLASSAAIGVVERDPVTLAEIMVGFEMSTALLVPWGLTSQIIAGGFAIAADLAAVFVLHDWSSNSIRSLLGVAVAGVFAAIAVRILEAGRKELFLIRMRQREMVSALSHDIRAPASAITMQAALLDEFATDDEVRSISVMIRASAMQVLGLAQNIVDSIRLDIGEMRSRSESFDLNLLVAEVVEELRCMAQVRTISIQFNSPAVPAPQCDPFQLRRAIANLLNHAIRATPEGGTILIDIANDRRCVEIKVKDSGPGLGPLEISRLFARESNTSGNSDQLGLYVSKRLAEQLGGKVEASSDPGRGTMLSISLPVT